MKEKSNIWFWPLILAVAISFVLVGLYSLHFFFQYEGLEVLRLGKGEDFAYFGSYIGGVLSPVLTLITIWVLVETLRTQKKEYNLTLNQHIKNELKTDLALAYAETKNNLETLINKPIKTIFKEYKGDESIADYGGVEARLDWREIRQVIHDAVQEEDPRVQMYIFELKSLIKDSLSFLNQQKKLQRVNYYVSNRTEFITKLVITLGFMGIYMNEDTLKLIKTIIPEINDYSFSFLKTDR